jgi:urea transport system permease protein
VVTVLPNGLVGLFKDNGIDRIKTFFGIRPQLVTYPSLEEDPEIMRKWEELKK